MRIAHIGDIHIRGISRHSEYRSVFEELNVRLREQKPDVILNAGDSFHTKLSGITGEYINLCRWWFTSLAEIAPVRIILGNHDFSVANLSRVDAVSPIVDAMRDPRVQLHRMSGVYRLTEGFNLCVYSIFDRDGWKGVCPVEGDCNIAAYHGPVNGCRTEDDWELSGDFSVGDFEGYDACCLSDIHRQQWLGFRGGRPWIGYSSSLIQQNFGEPVDKHGYVLWEVEKGRADATFHELTNPAPFLTIDWLGSVERTLACALLPERFRLRVRSVKHISQRDAQLLTAALNARHDVLELVFKNDHQRSVEDVIVLDGNNTLERANMRDPETLLKLVKFYYGDTLSLSDDENATMLDLIKGYASTLPSEGELARSTKWSLKDLTFDNTFGYGEGNRVDFSSLSGIVGLFGQNRAGKSSIIGTIVYALFNTTDRGTVGNQHVVNVRKQHCSARVVLNIAGVDHIVERITVKKEVKNGTIYAPTSLNVSRSNIDGTEDDLVGEQRTDTEKVIRGLIGTVGDFMLTSLAPQDEMHQFIRHGSTKRRQILSKFLDVDIFDRLHEVSNKDVSAVRAQLKGLQNVTDEMLVELEQKLRNVVSQLEKLVEEHNDAVDDERSFAERAQQLSVDGIIVTRDDVDEHEKKLERIRANSNDQRIKISKLNASINKLRGKIEKIVVLKSEHNITVLRSTIESSREKRARVEKLNHDLDRERRVRDQQKRSLKLLDEVPCGDMFKECQFIKDAHASKEKLPEQSQIVDSLIDSIDVLAHELDEMGVDDALERLKKIEKLVELESKLNLELLKNEHDLQRAQDRVSGLDDEATVVESRLLELRQSFDADASAALIDARERLQAVRARIRAIDSQKMELAAERGRLQSQLDHKSDVLRSRNSLLDNLKLHDMIVNAFSKKGLPSRIIASQLPVVNEMIADLLHGIVNFTVQLEIDDETDFLEVYIDYGDSRRIIELASGMEKMIASLAIRVALIQVSTLPKSDMLIIDEGFGALDAAGVEACSRLLTALKEHFRVLLIVSHVDGLKDVADTTIDITKEGSDSHVFCVPGM